jgi:hypothetical protein
MRAVSITGHPSGHRSNAPRLTDIGAFWPAAGRDRSSDQRDTLTGFIAAGCRKWVLVGSSAGEALSLICTPHRGISRLIEISGWLW